MPIRFSGMIVTWQTGVLALSRWSPIGVVTSTLPGAPRGAAAAGRSAALRDADRRCVDAVPVLTREVVHARPWHGPVRRNAFRAALSMLGISWGIVSVVMLLAYGDGFRDALDGRLPRRLRRRRRGDLAGPDQPAGRRRARRPARPAQVGRRRRRSPSCRWSSSSSPEFIAATCRSPTATSSRATASAASTAIYGEMRAETAAPGRAASSTTRTCGCGAASRSSAARSQRKLFGGQPAGRRDDPHRRACRSRSSA